MNCKKCGYELEEKWSYCPKCNTPTKDDLLFKYQKQYDQYDQHNQYNQPLHKPERSPVNQDQKDYSFVIVAIFLASVLVGILAPQLRIACFLVCLISVVTGKILYPKNVLITIMFVIFIVFVVLVIAYIVFAMVLCGIGVVACLETIRSCP